MVQRTGNFGAPEVKQVLFGLILGDLVLIAGDGAGVTTERAVSLTAPGTPSSCCSMSPTPSSRPMTCTTDRHDDQHDEHDQGPSARRQVRPGKRAADREQDRAGSRRRARDL